METFLLNPNVPAQNPVSQQGASAADSNGEGGFSPLLNEAVNTLENSENGQGNTEQANTPLAHSDDELKTLIENTAAQSFMNSIDPNSTKTADTPVVNTALVATVANKETPLPGQVSLPTGTAAELPKEIVQQQTINPVQTQPEKETTLLAQESPAPVSPQGSNNALVSTSKVESLLLQQIQQILDQGKNSGSIVITANNNTTPGEQSAIDPLQNLANPLLADAGGEGGAIQARQVGFTVPTTDDTTISTQKAVKLEGAHQGISEQYLNAKLGESKNNTSENLQQNNSQQKGAEQQLSTESQASTNGTPGATLTDAKGAESSFGQQLGLNSSTSTPTTSVEGKMAPGELPVPEKELVNTLIQRFNVNPRLQTSKLTMQLHPAELGALKIDILVKDDSIKANIVAQSQQVLETLEKHMPRLRTVLQEQGFTVDSFEISMEGDGGNQKELFQEHFNSQQQQEFAFTKSSASNRDQSFDALLESTDELDETDNDSGVNLTV